jgi:hypothetical protein
VRAAFAIIFALVLGITQAALPANGPGQLKPACRNCGCPRQACCYDQGTRNTSSAPMAPVRQLSSEQLQLLARELTNLIFNLPAEAAFSVSSRARFSSATAVPIYYRNCSLLI